MRGWGSPSREQLVFAACVVASSMAHVLVARFGPSDGGASRVLAGVDRRGAGEVPIEVVRETTSDLPRSDVPLNRAVEDAVVPGGGHGPTRPDTGVRGRGGQAAVSESAVNLADRDDHLTLSRELTSRLDRDQLQRLETARERASHDDRRSSREPMNLVFLATGAGSLEERHPHALTNPSRGALRAPAFAQLGASSNGGSDGPEVPTSGKSMRDQPDDALAWFQVGLDGRPLGKAAASPGLGVYRAVSALDHRRSARVATGRPLVTRAAPSVAADQSGRPRDNVDSDQEVASTLQALVHASTAGGALGEGQGGTEGRGPAASGGQVGTGSRAEPMGSGPGAFLAQGGQDPYLSAYRRSVIAKIYPLWENAFPKSASYEGKQGRAIVAMTIYADGHVDDVRLARASGVPEFDVNVQSAVRRAAPFEAFPASIPGPSMRWSITFDMNNPAVR
jgi:TonB family protein